MFIDFRELETNKKIEADICIIGAGAAGITLARSLIGSNIQICLLESGGFEFDNAIQSLYEGKQIGIPCGDLRAARLRFFGGTTNHWAGWCGPLNEIDFETRPWVPCSGWPISKKDLDPYYEKAQTVCELGPYRYDVAAWSDEKRRFPLFHPNKLTTQFWQYSYPPTRFGIAYRHDLEKAQNVHVYLYANVIQLETNESASEVSAVRIRTLSGKMGSVRAKYYVLACGGVENARLLLLSNQVENAGLGNHYDLVGRFFMEHPTVWPGQVLANEPDRLSQLFHAFKKDKWHVLAGICPTAEAQRQKQILNYSVMLERPTNLNTGYVAMYQLAQAYKQRRWPDDFSSKLWTVITDLDSAFEYLYDTRIRRDVNFPRTGSMFGLTTQIEQVPNPNSRVFLTEERDELGLNKVALDWQLTDLDYRTIRIATELIGEEFGRMALGRVKLADWLMVDNTNWPESLYWGWHHMGTTRMADDPKQGVVDRNCQVHSVANLYIAGSSIFTTSGYVNPTLTIVAFTLRLADYLKHQFRA